VFDDVDGDVDVWPNVEIEGCPKAGAALLAGPKADAWPNPGPDVDAWPKALGLPKAELVEGELAANAD